MNYKKQILKIYLTTCNPELKKASLINGTESDKELQSILMKCLDIQGIALLNKMRVA